MDWKLTKNYIIIFLLILNIILIPINLVGNNKFKLSELYQDSIKTFLEKENIKIYSDIPKSFKPIEPVIIEKVEYDTEFLKKVFLKNNKDIEEFTQYQTLVLKAQNEALFINSENVFYENNNKAQNFQFTKAESIKTAESIKAPLEQKYGKMTLDTIFKNNEYFYISFIQSINKYKIFNNYLNFKVYKDGRLHVNFSNYKKIDFKDEKLEICSADQALYTFSNEIKNLFFNEEIYIRQIDLGYYLNYSENDFEYVLNPYYRVYIKNSEMPFYINAVTNTFEYSVNYSTFGAPIL